jgi:cell division septal protein FtsQ
MPRREAFVVEERGKGPAPRILRALILPAILLTVIGVTVAVAIHLAESFLLHDRRFTFLLPPVPGEPSTLAVAGLSRTHEESIRRVFRTDAGKSVYEIPLTERRRGVESLDWIRHATIARRWPNRIEVYVIERQPAAFVQLPAGRGRHRTSFIDADGYLMPITERDRQRYDLPTLFGVREDQKPADRALRVRQMQRFYRQVAELGLIIPEVHLHRLENLKCRVKLGDRGYLLLLGKEDFAYNLDRFRKHLPEIERRMPDAVVLDLRIRETITASDEEKDGE